MIVINHESYVSFAVAKLLKELGFDLKCRCYYETSGKLRGKNSGNFYDHNSPLLWQNNGDTDTQLYSAPTLEVAQRWLREVKNCYVGVEVFVHNLDKNNIYYTYNWIVYLDGDRYSGSDIDTTRYYEVSQESGIKKALELILEKGE